MEAEAGNLLHQSGVCYAGTGGAAANGNGLCHHQTRSVLLKHAYTQSQQLSLLLHDRLLSCKACSARMSWLPHGCAC